jgi:hypothetical protein
MSELTKSDLAEIELWTSKDMTFRINGSMQVIPAGTKCVKPKYTKKIKGYLGRMDVTGFGRPESMKKTPVAVCVKLRGQLRYVWRTDVLTEKESDEYKKENSHKLGVFAEKLKGAVGKS